MHFDTIAISNALIHAGEKCEFNDIRGPQWLMLKALMNPGEPWTMVSARGGSTPPSFYVSMYNR